MYDDSKAFPSHTEHLGEITIIYHHVCQGGTPDLKWWGWLNQGKNQNPK